MLKRPNPELSSSLSNNKIQQLSPNIPYSISTQRALLFDEKLYNLNQRSLIGELMSLYHDDLHTKHWSIEKTKELLKRKFYWPDINTDVENYIKTYPICQRKTINTYKPYKKLISLPTPSKLWKDISIDWITGLLLLKTKDSQIYNDILTVVDRFNCIALFITCQNITNTVEFVEMVYKEVEIRFGPLTNIVNDRDSRITSRF